MCVLSTPLFTCAAGTVHDSPLCFKVDIVWSTHYLAVRLLPTAATLLSRSQGQKAGMAKLFPGATW